MRAIAALILLVLCTATVPPAMALGNETQASSFYDPAPSRPMTMEDMRPAEEPSPWVMYGVPAATLLAMLLAGIALLVLSRRGIRMPVLSQDRALVLLVIATGFSLVTLVQRDVLARLGGRLAGPNAHAFFSDRWAFSMSVVIAMYALYLFLKPQRPAEG